MDEFRRSLRSAFEDEWGGEPPADLGVRSVAYAVRAERPARHRSPLLLAAAAAAVLAIAAAGTLVYIARAGRPATVPAATPTPAPVGTPASSTPVSPTPVVAREPLLVVLRRDATTAASEVLLVDRTGAIHARASFDGAPRPRLGNAAPLVQSPVRVAAGAVFFADAHGVVRRLDRDGAVTVVTTFPMTGGQQELSFAVSPDGRRLVASILTTPPLRTPPPQSPTDPVFVDGGHWSLQLFTADAGGSPVSTLQRDLGSDFPAPTVVVGWDQGGPLATLHTSLGTQNAPASDRFFGDALIHMAGDGGHLDQVGGGGCKPLDELSDGTVLCYEGSQPDQFEVRRASGALLWRHDMAKDHYAGQAQLSPDGSRVAVADLVLSSAGGQVAVAAAATPDVVAGGWLDDHTVAYAAANGDGPITLVNVDDQRETRRLPVSGRVAGTA